MSSVPRRLPGRLEACGVVLRRWEPDDVKDLHSAITTSVEHLRPWMPWVAFEPLTIEQRAELIQRWEEEWTTGGDAHLGIFVEGLVAGGCGLHWREDPNVLAMGYWLRPQYVGKGLAAAAGRALITGAFSLPGIAAVEIFHDKANQRSAAVARRLGFEFVAESSYKAEATGEGGVGWTWRMNRSRWERRA